MLGVDEIDALTEQIVEALLVRNQPPGSVAFAMARRLAREHPDTPALMLALPFALAGDAIETMLGGGAEARARAQDSWQIAALIAAELAVLTGLGGSVAITVLADHWDGSDPVFRPIAP